MTWTPPARAEWVAAVNAGLIVPINDVAVRRFDRDDLLAEARAFLGTRNRGSADFGDDSFFEPLDVLVQAFENEAQLTILGRWITRRFVLRMLEVRLQLVAYVAA